GLEAARFRRPSNVVRRDAIRKHLEIGAVLWRAWRRRRRRRIGCPVLFPEPPNAGAIAPYDAPHRIAVAAARRRHGAHHNVRVSLWPVRRRCWDDDLIHGRLHVPQGLLALRNAFGRALSALDRCEIDIGDKRAATL